MHAYLMTNDVARVSGKSPETVRYYERIGKLPAIKTMGGKRLYSRADVEKFLLELKAKQPPEAP